jgi:DNA-binding CsgD family transcriptional regulator
MQAPFADPLAGLELQTKLLPLVGRETEMQLIRSLLDTVAFDRPVGARALTISGETGVGKSRLLAEMCAEARARGFRVLEGRAYESGKMFPYLPFIEALRPILRSSSAKELRHYVGLDNNEHISPASEAGVAISLIGPPLVATLARLFPELPQLIRVTITPEVLSPDQEKFRLLDAVATLLERIAIDQPVLLCIDNVQWADNASLELMMYLTVRLHSSRVALVGVTRPPTAIRESDQNITTPNVSLAAARMLGDLMRQGLLLLLPVGPLRSDAASQHLHALLPGILSENLAQSLLTRAEGNPFFLEELVRILTISHLLVLRDGVWRALRPFGSELPDSITLAVGQRLSELSAPCRELLRVASLFGRTFPIDALLTVLKEPEESAQALIDEATQASVIARVPVVDTTWDGYTDDDEEHSEHRSTKIVASSFLDIQTSNAAQSRLRFASGGLKGSLTSPSYIFCQGIVQEVLSAEVPTHRARSLHGAIGAALEASYAGTAPAHAAELARHYILGGEKQAALYWSLLAGEDAAHQEAHREAISHFRLVLRLLESGVTSEMVPSPAQLHIVIGESWFRLGELGQAQDAFQRALDLLQNTPGISFVGIPGMGALGEDHENVGTPLVGVLGVGVLEGDALALQLAQANRLLADVYRMQGKYDLVLAHLQAAHSALDTTGGTTSRQILSEAKDDTAASKSDLVTSVPWFPGRSFSTNTGGVNLQRVGITERILFLQAQATLDMFLNRPKEAEAAWWQSHQLATEIGDRGSQAFAMHMIGWLRGWSEHIHDAIRLMEQAHELYVAIGDPFRAALGDQGLGIIYQALGEMERARLYNLRGIERARRYGVRRILGWLYWNQGVMALAQGDWASSESQLQKALQEAETNSDVRLKPVVLQAQAELHFRRGSWHEAERCFQASIQAAANTEWLPGSMALYGHFLAVTGRQVEARAQLDRAAAHPEPPGFGGDFYIPFLAEGYIHLGANKKAATYIERIRSLHGFMYYGCSVDRILGVVASLEGDWETAEQAFEEGLALCRRANNRPEEAAIFYEQARAALMQSGTGSESTQYSRHSLERMHDLCEQARELFLQYDMQRAADLVETLQVGVEQLEQRNDIKATRQYSLSQAKPSAPSRNRPYSEHNLHLHLTKREQEVLCLVAEGHTDREVAETLVISPRTVNRHLSNIFVKLDVPGRAAAVAYAIRQGLV